MVDIAGVKLVKINKENMKGDILIPWIQKATFVIY